MSVIRISKISILFIIILASINNASSKTPSKIPSFPQRVEVISLGTDGPCAAIAYHNANEKRVTDFGISQDGLDVQRGAYDLEQNWLMEEGCSPVGWSAVIGGQTGQKISTKTINIFFMGGYEISPDPDMKLTLFLGLVYEGLNQHKRHPPKVINFFGLYPTFGIEYTSKF